MRIYRYLPVTLVSVNQNTSGNEQPRLISSYSCFLVNLLLVINLFPIEVQWYCFLTRLFLSQKSVVMVKNPYFFSWKIALSLSYNSPIFICVYEWTWAKPTVNVLLSPVFSAVWLCWKMFPYQCWLHLTELHSASDCQALPFLAACWHLTLLVRCEPECVSTERKTNF